MERAIGVEVASEAGRVHLGRERVRLGHLRGGDPIGQQPAGGADDARAHVVDRHRVVAPDAPDEHAAVGDHRHEAAAMAGLDRLADRAAADAQPVGPRRLGELGPGRQRAREDDPLDLAFHLRRQAEGAQGPESLRALERHDHVPFPGSPTVSRPRIPD